MQILPALPSYCKAWLLLIMFLLQILFRRTRTGVLLNRCNQVAANMCYMVHCSQSCHLTVTEPFKSLRKATRLTIAPCPFRLFKWMCKVTLQAEHVLHFYTLLYFFTFLSLQFLRMPYFSVFRCFQ